MKIEQFGTVTQKAKRIAVVGTGQSLRNCSWNIPDSVVIIAINGAIDILPRADYWFTLDPSPLNRSRMAKQRAGTIYFAAVPDDYGEKNAATDGHKAPPEPNVIYLRRMMGHIHRPLRLRYGLCDYVGAVHTGNSAWGGLQVACHMDPERVALLGIDGHGSYVYGGRPKTLDHLPKLFETGVADLEKRNIKVVNGSPISTITCFLRMSPDEALAWLAAE